MTSGQTELTRLARRGESRWWDPVTAAARAVPSVLMGSQLLPSVPPLLRVPPELALTCPK